MGLFDFLKNIFAPKPPVYMQHNQGLPKEAPSAETIEANKAFYTRAFVALVATQFESAGKDYKKYTELMRVKDLPDKELIKYSGLYAGVSFAKGEKGNTLAMMNGLVAEFPDDPLLLDYYVQLIRDINLDKDEAFMQQLLVPNIVNEVTNNEPLSQKELYITYSKELLNSVLNDPETAFNKFKTKMLRLGYNEQTFIDRTYELTSLLSFEEKKEEATLLYNGLSNDFPDSILVKNLAHEMKVGRKQFRSIMNVEYAKGKFEEAANNYAEYKQLMIGDAFDEEAFVKNTAQLAIALFYEHRIAEVQVLYDGLAKEYPDNHYVIWLYLEIVSIMYLPNSENLVKHYFELKQQKDDFSHHYDVEYFKALELRQHKHYQVALNILLELTKFPEFHWNYYQIGITYNYLGDTENALAYVIKAVNMSEEIKEDAKTHWEIDNLRSNPELMKLLE